MIKKSK